MSLQERNTALIVWLSEATGLEWIWQGQDEVRPSYPYGSVNIIGESSVGQEHVSHEVDDTLPVGSDTRMTIKEERRLTAQLNVQAKHDASDPTGFHDARAMAFMDSVRKSALRPSARKKLSDVGLVIIRFETAQHVPETHNGEFISRATMDVHLRHVAVDTPESEIGSIIEQVEVTTGIEGAPESLELNNEGLP